MDHDVHRWRTGLDDILGCCVRLIIANVLITAIFSLHQWQLGHWEILDNYLDPLLTIPFMGGWGVWLMRWFQRDFTWKWFNVIIFTIGISITFEWWIPSFDSRFTADIGDVVAYFLGAFGFMWIQRLPKAS